MVSGRTVEKAMKRPGPTTVAVIRQQFDNTASIRSRDISSVSPAP